MAPAEHAGGRRPQHKSRQQSVARTGCRGSYQLVTVSAVAGDAS